MDNLCRRILCFTEYCACKLCITMASTSVLLKTFDVFFEKPD